MDENRYTEARKIADSASSGTVSALVSWWKEYCEEDRAASEISYKTPPINPFCEIFEATGLEVAKELKDGFEEFRSNPTGDDVDDLYYDAASILIARAVAESIIDSPSSWRDIRLALIVCEYNSAFMKELEQYIVERLKREDSRFKWVEALKRGEWEAERAVYSIDRSNVESLKVAWEREKEPFSVWDETTGFLGISSDSFYPLVLLFRAQLPDWVAEFERLPLPVVKYAFIDSLECEFSKERVMELIKNAPPLFADDTWTRNSAILYAPILCLRKATSGEPKGQEPPSLKTELAEILNSLIARPDDGLIISWHFQEWLLEQYHAALGRGQAEVLQPVINAVTELLARKAQTFPQPNWFCLLGAILVEYERVSASQVLGIPEPLYERYLCLLKDLDDDLLSILSSYSSSRQLEFYSYWSGYLFTAFSSFQCKWEEAWLALNQQREDAWYWNFNGKDPITGSIALIEAGLGCLSWQQEKKVTSDELFLFWRKLLQCAVGIWVRRQGYFAESSRRLIIRCLLHATACLRDNLVDCVKEFVTLVDQDAELTAQVALNMQANDVGPKELLHFFQQGPVDLAQSMAAVIEWADLSKKKDEVDLAKRCAAFLKRPEVVQQ